MNNQRVLLLCRYGGRVRTKNYTVNYEGGASFPLSINRSTTYKGLLTKICSRIRINLLYYQLVITCKWRVSEGYTTVKIKDDEMVSDMCELYSTVRSSIELFLEKKASNSQPTPMACANAGNRGIRTFTPMIDVKNDSKGFMSSSDLREKHSNQYEMKDTQKGRQPGLMQVPSCYPPAVCMPRQIGTTGSMTFGGGNSIHNCNVGSLPNAAIPTQLPTPALVKHPAPASNQCAGRRQVRGKDGNHGQTSAPVHTKSATPTPSRPPPPKCHTNVPHASSTSVVEDIHCTAPPASHIVEPTGTPLSQPKGHIFSSSSTLMTAKPTGIPASLQKPCRKVLRTSTSVASPSQVASYVLDASQSLAAPFIIKASAVAPSMSEAPLPPAVSSTSKAPNSK